MTCPFTSIGIRNLSIIRLPLSYMDILCCSCRSRVFLGRDTSLRHGVWRHARNQCDTSGCRHYWWVMCLWGILAIFNGLLVHYNIREYPTRRRGNRRLTPRIMFTPSGDPVAVTLSPATSGQLASSRHLFDSLPRVGPQEYQ